MKRVILDFLKGLWFGICSLVGFIYATLSIITFCNIYRLEDAWEAIMTFFVGIIALVLAVTTFVLIGNHIRKLEEQNR